MNTRSSPILAIRSASAGAMLLGVLLGHQPARGVEQTDADELGDRVDQAGAAQPAGLDVADDAAA